jgi:hypothetical protein
MNSYTGSSVLIVPSWVIPGTYAENLCFLEGKKEIEGVELLFFLYDENVKNQLESEWEEISRYRERFIFTAHLPELLLPAQGELVARLAPLVRHFIVHPSAENPLSQVQLLGEWAKSYNVSFLVENTNPGRLEALLPCLEQNAGLCMDTGHLLLMGQNPADFFARHRERIKEIHLHGANKEQAAIDGNLVDHRRLIGDEPWLLELLPLLKNYQGIINLEVFSWEEASASIEILRGEF